MILFVSILLPALIGVILALQFASATTNGNLFFFAIVLHLMLAVVAGSVADHFGFSLLVDMLLSPDWLPPLQILELLFCAASVSGLKGVRLIPSPVVMTWMVLSCALLQRYMVNIDGLLCGLTTGIAFILSAVLYFWLKQKYFRENDVEAYGGALLIGLIVIFIPVSLNTHLPSRWSVSVIDTLPWLGLCGALVVLAFISWPRPAKHNLRKTDT